MSKASQLRTWLAFSFLTCDVIGYAEASSATYLAFEIDCFCDESYSSAESEQVSRMTNAFGSFGETKEQNELQISN